jgi:hypothetical protein
VQVGAAELDDDLFDDEDDERFLERWAEAERHAAGVVAEALAGERGRPPPAALGRTSMEVRAGIAAGSYPLSWVARAAGFGTAPREADAELLLDCAAAVMAPREETGLDPEEESMLLSLELGDWAGAVIELVREGAGAFARPRDLVAAIDRCPEIDDATEADDIGLVETALSTAQLAWMALGLIDRDDRLTEVGAWVLPRALTRAWGVAFDGPSAAPDA